MDKDISNVPVNFSGESSVSCNMDVAVSNVPDNFSGFNDSEDTVVFQPLLASRMPTSDLNAHLNLIAPLQDRPSCLDGFLIEYSQYSDCGDIDLSS